MSLTGLSKSYENREKTMLDRMLYIRARVGTAVSRRL